MSMTYEQAIAVLNNPEYRSIEGLRALVNQVSVEVSSASGSATTLFYSGNLGDLPA